MGTLREHFRTTLLGTALLIQPAPSFTLTDDPVRIFATCAGRMSAVMEHQWLTDGPGSEETKLLRDAHLALLEATASPEMTGLALNWRIDAKVAQANLLNLASFGPHPTARRLAHFQAERLTEACTALLLGQS